MYCVLSGGTNTWTSAFGTGLPVAQSKTAPRMSVAGMNEPVEKTITIGRLTTLPWRSASPGRSVTVYAVIGFQGRWLRTSRRSRCQPTRGSPSRGEMRMSPLRFCAEPAGRSETTSSNLKITLLPRKLTAPLSGETESSTGGVCRGGPPGGKLCCAHAAASATASTSASRRTAPFSSRRAARGASSIRRASSARSRPPRASRAP